jgi:hypothetical protein
MAIGKAFLELIMTMAIGAQPPLRKWRNGEEYNLAAKASAESDPKQRIPLLLEGSARYPPNDFERERLISFALAFEQTGRARESFKRTREALTLNADDPSVFLLTASVEPTLSDRPRAL